MITGRSVPPAAHQDVDGEGAPVHDGGSSKSENDVFYLAYLLQNFRSGEVCFGIIVSTVAPLLHFNESICEVEDFPRQSDYLGSIVAAISGGAVT